MNQYSESEFILKKAQKYIPGGVNSPVRAFKNVGGTPVFIKKAMGSYLYDEDNNKYIDYLNSWGPMILGHSHPEVIEAVRRQATLSFSTGTPTVMEVNIAELINSLVPNIEMIRLVNSGTEACMSAVRLARGYTGRNKIIKFSGCYHGHADVLLSDAGSGLATFNIQSIPGVPKGATSDTISLAYNDLNIVNETFDKYKDEIAAVIIEPVAGNMGCILPKKGYLKGIRKLCTEHKSLLIFDEVMTGFRLSLGGAQQLFNIDADIITYGKIIGGGMPMGAFGGKKEIMQNVAPLGKVYQAGTLSGNPLSVIAGYTTLNILKNNPQIYTSLEQKSNLLKTEMSKILNKKGVNHIINNVGSMISVFFNISSAENFNDAASSDLEFFKKFFHHMLKNGIHLPPSAFETWFISNSLSNEDIEKTLETVKSL